MDKVAPGLGAGPGCRIRSLPWWILPDLEQRAPPCGISQPLGLQEGFPSGEICPRADKRVQVRQAAPAGGKTWSGKVYGAAGCSLGMLGHLQPDGDREEMEKSLLELMVGGERCWIRSLLGFPGVRFPTGEEEQS